jgi:UDP-N-acetylglucosamine diphosphorylase/glucosamine-1-phosphate N-acetyltransferase
MKAFVLAAGQGVRMGPLTENKPKPMLPVAGRPFLEHTLLALRDANVTDITILTGYHGAAITDHFGDGSKFGLSISYLVQPQRLGTAHAVGMAKDVIREPFLCINGDVIVTSDLIRGMVSQFGRNGLDLMTLVTVEDGSRFGVVEVSGGNVSEIIEKPSRIGRALVNSGIYLLRPHIFEAIKRTPRSPRGEYELTQSLRYIMEKDKVQAYVPSERWVDIGSPWDLLMANEIYMGHLRTSIIGDVEEGVHVKGKLILGKGATIKSGTYLEGDVFIDEGAVIGPNAYIRGSTYIGKRSKVGAGSEVKNSIIMDDSHIPHHNYVGDSIIGSGCNLGSGTKVANLRIDGRTVPVVLKGQRVDSGLRKLGVIMGDDVKTGVNASIDPGTVIFSGTRIGAGTRISGTIGKDSWVL